MSVPLNRDQLLELARDWYYIAESWRRHTKGATLAFAYFHLARKAAELLQTPEIHWIYAGTACSYADAWDVEAALLYFSTALEILESVASQQALESFRLETISTAIPTYHQYQNF